MAENLLTVAALRTNVEADLIRGKLEAAGISAVLVEPEPSAEGAPPGRVQVQVSQPDFERAMQLLFPIPKMPAARPSLPGWMCPKCGQHVIGQFPTCWSCGTARPPSPEAAAPPAPMSGPAPFAGMPRMPAPPSLPPGAAPPPLQAPPRLSIPETETPALASGSQASAEAVAASTPLAVPPLAPPAPKPATNGESLSRIAPLAPVPRTRTAEDDGLRIVVPAWDPATGKGPGASNSRERSPTEADDRAARRAWWTAVAGIACPPVLLYSITVVLILGLTNRPLSRRGHRFFYGALALNALIIAAFFILSGMLQ